MAFIIRIVPPAAHAGAPVRRAVAADPRQALVDRDAAIAMAASWFWEVMEEHRRRLADDNPAGDFAADALAAWPSRETLVARIEQTMRDHGGAEVEIPDRQARASLRHGVFLDEIDVAPARRHPPRGLNPAPQESTHHQNAGGPR